MQTRDHIFTQFLVRNNRSTTDGFMSEDNLKQWYRDAHLWATAYKKWPFTEGRLQTTFTTGSGPNGDEWYFEGIKADSIRFMQIGTKRLQKLNFEDYQIMREDTSNSQDRVYSDFGRTVFINPNADVSGTVYAYAQYQPYIDVTDEVGNALFTGYDEEGNESLVEKMSSFLKRKEHLPDEAELHDQRAATKLDELYKRIQDEQSVYQTTRVRGGMFKRVDVIDGGFFSDEIKRDQF